MSLALQKILIAGTNTGQPGSYWQNANISCGVGNATAGLATVFPAGVYLVPGTASLNIEVNMWSANLNSWTFLFGNATGGVVISDGTNVRANAATGTVTFNALVVDLGPSANVAGTFNAS